ncbi:MAG TPA: hypothetical protein VJV05_05415, partial [Pyrinomonadaceae bacterium]|nr:hypothetical protein [Pyrinomonadaceae bacterium]
MTAYSPQRELGVDRISDGARVCERKIVTLNLPLAYASFLSLALTPSSRGRVKTRVAKAIRRSFCSDVGSRDVP